MNIPDVLSALVKIEEGYDAKLNDEEVTPAEARQWRLRQLRRLRDSAAAQGSAPEPQKTAEAPDGELRPKLIGNDPTAKTRRDLVLPNQLSTLKALARSKGLNPDEVCQYFYKCNTEDLNQTHANLLADYFRGYVPPKAERLRAV